MGIAKRNPAVYAGLVGSVATLYPQTAMALPLEEALSQDASTYVVYALGCVTGAAVATAVFALHAAIRATRAAKNRRAQKDEAQVVQAEAPIADSPSGTGAIANSQRRHARHMGMREWEASGIIRVQDPLEQADDPVPAKQDNDYDIVAENYVRGKSLAQRMASRAAGVAGVLAERLGTSTDMFEDMPIIARADGTVGDVGTKWWTDALGDSIRGIEDVVPGVEMSVDDMLNADRQPQEARRPSVGETRAAYISKNVAEVDVGIYPEHRTSAELDNEDIWDMALKAMDEQFAQQAPAVFHDVIGGIDTIDEPGDLESPTGFIPFRTPAGHPEVVDTSTYVDYLIDDEFSRNPSPVARQSSRDFLTVIQGGSQRMAQTVNEEPSAPRRPRHMAVQKPAKEA